MTDQSMDQSAIAMEARKHPRDWLANLVQKHAHKHPDMPAELQGKALVVAPMVDASDLPYRLLTRRYNANLCFTPMIHARLFTEREAYRRKFWKLTGMPKEDRPLIAQFCGHDKHVLLEAMKSIQHQVDGVDINCGCPQGIARRGRYGAFLMEEDEGDLIVGIVRHLVPNLDVPVSVKLRILPSRSPPDFEVPRYDETLDLYERLVDAGAAMLTIHGRTRLNKMDKIGASDWGFIRRVVERVGHRVPVVSNGSIANLDEVRECLRVTGADGVMSSEGVLEYPPLFTETNVASTGHRRTAPGRLEIARDYLDLAREYPPYEGGQGSKFKCIRAHLHRFLHADLQRRVEIRDAVIGMSDLDDAYGVLDLIQKIHDEEGHRIEDEELSWYVRHRVKRETFVEEKKEETVEEEEPEELCPCDMFGEKCGDDGDY